MSQPTTRDAVLIITMENFRTPVRRSTMPAVIAEDIASVVASTGSFLGAPATARVEYPGDAVEAAMARVVTARAAVIAADVQAAREGAAEDTRAREQSAMDAVQSMFCVPFVDMASL